MDNINLSIIIKSKKNLFFKKKIKKFFSSGIIGISLLPDNYTQYETTWGKNMDYARYSELKQTEYEQLCIRCGGCCGAYDDPCRHLKCNDDGRYYCDIYNNRFGLRKTVSGDEFHCVPIREILASNWPRDYLCLYKRFR